jgi:orotate phosphoribosyltransferase
MFRTEQGWIEEYKRVGALWIHDGAPESPHVRIRSGLHTNGYFESTPIIANKKLVSEAASDMFESLLGYESFDVEKIDVVVGPEAGGSTVLLQEMAQKVSGFRGRECRWAATYKHQEGEGTVLILRGGNRQQVKEGDCMLLVDDVFSTGSSIKQVMGAVRFFTKTTRSAGYIATIVNRSARIRFHDNELVSLIRHPMQVWDARNHCDLCDAGSPVVNPSELIRFTAEYPQPTL